jgi:GNAT superfamily N-acetyltransferase
VRSDLAVGRATAADWDEIVAWTAGEGWNPGLGDAGCFLPTDPAGFFVGRLGGRVVSAVSIVTYCPGFAFLGYYVVRPGHRGAGLGSATWRAALPHAGNRVVGLDAVPAQKSTYERAGFAAAYRNVRHSGRPTAAGSPAPGNVHPVTPRHHEAIARYDRNGFPADRPEFVVRWLTAEGHVARVLLDGDRRVRGYGVVRPAHQGYRVGPLFADGPDEAGALLDALVAALPSGAEVAVDVPDLHPAAAKLVADRGLAPVSECVRMYTGQAPAIRTETVFGTTTLELG